MTSAGEEKMMSTVDEIAELEKKLRLLKDAKKIEEEAAATSSGASTGAK